MAGDDVDVFFSSEDEFDSDYEIDIVNKLSFSSQFSRKPESICSRHSRYDPTGRDTYTEACHLLKVTPAQQFIRCMTHPEVDLSHRGLGPTGVRAAAIALLKNTCVSKLNLKDNGMGEEGMKCICVIFEQNYFITDLDVADNGCKVKGAEYIAKMLAFCNTLKRLDVSGNDIGNHGVELIADALSINYTLESLSLSNNNMSEVGANALRKALDGNISLRELNLSWNNLRSKGAKAIAKALTGNSSLQMLDLSWGGIGDDGVKPILTALKDNTSLTSLNVASNRIGDAGAKLLIEAISENETLETLDITMNLITKHLLMEIVKARMDAPTSKLKVVICRDKTFANDKQIAEYLCNMAPADVDFKLELEHIKIKDDPNVVEWQEKHKEDLCERFLAFIRGRRIRMMDLFQKFGASGDLVLSVSKFCQGLEKLRKEMRMSDWEIRDLADYLRGKDGQIHCSYLTSL